MQHNANNQYNTLLSQPALERLTQLVPVLPDQFTWDRQELILKEKYSTYSILLLFLTIVSVLNMIYGSIKSLVVAYAMQKHGQLRGASICVGL